MAYCWVISGLCVGSEKVVVQYRLFCVEIYVIIKENTLATRIIVSFLSRMVTKVSDNHCFSSKRLEMMAATRHVLSAQSLFSSKRAARSRNYPLTLHWHFVCKMWDRAHDTSFLSTFVGHFRFSLITRANNLFIERLLIWSLFDSLQNGAVWQLDHIVWMKIMSTLALLTFSWEYSSFNLSYCFCSSKVQTINILSSEINAHANKAIN